MKTTKNFEPGQNLDKNSKRMLFSDVKKSYYLKWVLSKMFLTCENKEFVDKGVSRKKPKSV